MPGRARVGGITKVHLASANLLSDADLAPRSSVSAMVLRLVPSSLTLFLVRPAGGWSIFRDVPRPDSAERSPRAAAVKSPGEAGGSGATRTPLCGGAWRAPTF